MASESGYSSMVHYLLSKNVNTAVFDYDVS